ncbi:PIN-like domain-containing protein [Curtobacterium sp. 1P10AnD]|uniref:PIN-like domain-containing protein n=1 Tax=Curtobacterium sp. 1P10AnD TaxID=3132283 RepID=UPI0039A0DCC1
MRLSEVESALFQRMAMSRLSVEHHLAALAEDATVDVLTLAGVGFDTNVLKVFRNDGVWTESMLVSLKSNSVAVIVPGQSVLEYWNNHKVFASEEWATFGADFARLARKLENGGLDRQNSAAVQDIQTRIASIADDLEAEKSPDYLKKSLELMELLLEGARKPMVSRSMFSGLARARQESRMPPGFADERSKSSSLGDFYVWCDFLLGASTLMLDTAPEVAGGARFLNHGPTDSPQLAVRLKSGNKDEMARKRSADELNPQDVEKCGGDAVRSVSQEEVQNDSEPIGWPPISDKNESTLFQRTGFVWVTNDSKPDWKTGGRGHPSLLEEFRAVTGGHLTIVSSSEFRALIDDQSRP